VAIIRKGIRTKVAQTLPRAINLNNFSAFNHNFLTFDAVTKIIKAEERLISLVMPVSEWGKLKDVWYLSAEDARGPPVLDRLIHLSSCSVGWRRHRGVWFSQHLHDLSCLPAKLERRDLMSMNDRGVARLLKWNFDIVCKFFTLRNERKLTYAKLSKDIRLPCSLLMFCCDPGWHIGRRMSFSKALHV
jgi:hypothetical protein